MTIKIFKKQLKLSLKRSKKDKSKEEKKRVDAHEKIVKRANKALKKLEVNHEETQSERADFYDAQINAVEARKKALDDKVAAQKAKAKEKKEKKRI